jgi:hypothetical protein
LGVFFFEKNGIFAKKKSMSPFVKILTQKKDQLGIKLDGTNAMESYCWGKIIVA